MSTQVRTILLVVAMLPAIAAAQGQQPVQSQQSPTVERNTLVELLRTAPPPPMTGRSYDPLLSSAPERSQIIRHDSVTGEDTIGLSGDGAAADSGPVLAGQAPVSPVPATSFDEPWSPPPFGWGSLDGEDFGGAHVPLACTPPSAYLYTHTMPWCTTYKLLMRYNVSGIDYYYACSASSFGDFHLLTAGHCLYSHDPNDDGSTDDARWASEVWAFAAQTDIINPFSDADHPYSFAKDVLLTTYVGWINNADLNHDMGYITLDRRDGSHTGWMGREHSYSAASLNFNGYPSETPYVPAGELRQYPGFDVGNVTGYTSYRINLCAYTYGGHSGGPVWRYDGTNRYVQGVNSTSNRTGAAAATLITSDRYNDMADIITNDEAVRPPLPRPDMAEYVTSVSDNLKDLQSNYVLQDHTFTIEYNALNAGFAGSGALTIDFYLSTNDIISSNDTQIGSLYFSGGLSAWTYMNPTTTLTASVNPGTYYAGWIMSCATPEYGGDLTCTNDPCSNVVVIADETLTVLDCKDVYEPDNAAGLASYISSGSPQTHGICPIGDEDWFYFIVNQPANIVLETSGASGDTRMWLHDSGLNLIEYDDDSGPGLFSRIDRGCGGELLPSGTYYVKVDEYLSDGVIDAYSISYQATPCGIFSNGFESGNTNAWSHTAH